MKQIARFGDIVRVHYTGKFDDNIFDTSINREPLEFKIGEGVLCVGFEHNIIGMSPGQTKTFKVPMEKGYGKYRKEWLITVDRKEFLDPSQLRIGAEVHVPQEDGSTMIFVVTHITDTEVTLDANHPLAGKDLLFKVKLLEIINSKE